MVLVACLFGGGAIKSAWSAYKQRHAPFMYWKPNIGMALFFGLFFAFAIYAVCAHL